MVITIRKAISAWIILRETVLPHLDPTTVVSTWLEVTPATLARFARTAAVWATSSGSVCTTTWEGFPGWAPVIWTTLATGPSAVETSPWLTACDGVAVKRPPPRKSRPNLRPGKNSASTEISIAMPESRNQRRQWPTEHPHGEEVDQRGEPQGEGEPAHRADGEPVQDQRGRKRHGVGRDQRMEGALPATFHRGTQRPAVADLVF